MAAVLVILAYTGGGQSREYYFGSVSRDSGSVTRDADSGSRDAGSGISGGEELSEIFETLMR